MYQRDVNGSPFEAVRLGLNKLITEYSKYSKLEQIHAK